jgi:hypothetical protein
VLVLLVKADTIDVNVAGSLRFTSEDWQAAGEVFSRELAGVQLLDERQVSEEVGCWVIEGVRESASNCTASQYKTERVHPTVQQASTKGKSKYSGSTDAV